MEARVTEREDRIGDKGMGFWRENGGKEPKKDERNVETILHNWQELKELPDKRGPNQLNLTIEGET